MSSQSDQGSKSLFRYKSATKIGKIPFTPPGTDRKCETAFWLWGDLNSEVTPLIALHGGPGAPGRELKPLAALYERHGIPILLYDQIGCGESTHLKDTRGDTNFWTMELFLAELDNVRSFLKIETFDLFGHSCGGMIAVSYALNQPRGLRKLIIASSPASEKLRFAGHAKRRAELPQDLQDTMTKCEKEGRCDDPAYGNAIQQLLRSMLCRMDPWPVEMQETMGLMQQDDTVSFTLYGPSPLEPSGSWTAYDVISRLPEITKETVPGGVLLTNGRYDMTTDEAMLPFSTGIRAPVKWERFAQSSHMPQMEEHEAFITALGKFLTT